MNSAEDRILSNMPKLLRTLQCEPLLNQDPLPSEVKREGKGVYVFRAFTCSMNTASLCTWAVQTD